MSWVKLDDHFPEHQKVSDLHDRAFRFHVTALCYCARNLTDGQLSVRASSVVAAVLSTTVRRWPAELVAAGLWRPDTDEFGPADGWWINDYLKYNPSAEQVKAERNAAAERMRNQRAVRSSAERSTARTGARSGTPSRPLVGDNPKELPTAWQPAFGHTNPVVSIRQQINLGVLTDRIDLDAELSAHPAMSDQDRAALVLMLEEKVA